jgi:hypothetical protein
MLKIGQEVEYRSEGVVKTGYISRIVTTDLGEAIGAIVDSPNNGSFFILTRVSKLPAGALVQYGSVQFRIK